MAPIPTPVPGFCARWAFVKVASLLGLVWRGAEIFPSMTELNPPRSASSGLMRDSRARHE